MNPHEIDLAKRSLEKLQHKLKGQESILADTRMELEIANVNGWSSVISTARAKAERQHAAVLLTKRSIEEIENSLKADTKPAKK